MAITLRNYRGPEDLRLQETFWRQATRELPWCWKPTVSPGLYSKSPQFDPRSRCFAFDGDRLAGYASFTGHDEFVSLGYPWVLPGYEGDLQETLYERTYGFAASPEYGGRTFAQRFRQPWTAQISFFERHGFAIQSTDPIYALSLRPATLENVSSQYQVACQPEFCWDDFEELSALRLAPEPLNQWRQYFQTVDFDFCVTATRKGKLAACLGLAIRQDTGFAELIAVALEPAEPRALPPCLSIAAAQSHLRNAKFLGTKSIPVPASQEVLAQMGFKKVSEEVLLSKSIS